MDLKEIVKADGKININLPTDKSFSQVNLHIIQEAVLLV